MTPPGNAVGCAVRAILMRELEHAAFIVEDAEDLAVQAGLGAEADWMAGILENLRAVQAGMRRDVA